MRLISPITTTTFSLLQLLLLLLPLCSSLLGTVHAWEKEDHEIFDLVSALHATEGDRATFYTFLGVPSTATEREIAKAFRQRSLELHPDKNKAVPHAAERAATLNVIAKILREPESRARYDYFHANGVPRWKGTGYFYTRFQPSLAHVLLFLLLPLTLAHHLVHRIAYRSQRARIHRILALALQARGSSGPGRRKVRVPASGESPEPWEAPPPMLELIVDADSQVFMVCQAATPPSLLPHSNIRQVNGEGKEVILDESLAKQPQWKDTFVPALARSALRLLIKTPPPSTDSSVAQQPTQTAEDGRKSTPRRRRK